MRVVHVIGSFDQGGAEKTLVTLLEHVDRDKHRQSVICVGPAKSGPILDAIERLGVTVAALDVKSVAALPNAVFRLRRLLRAERPDIVQAWMYHSNVLSSLAATGLGGPAILWNVRHTVRHVWWDEKPVTAASIALGARLSRRADRIIYCANASRLAHEAIGYAPSHGAVIYNGVDATTYRPMPEERLRVRAEIGVPPESELVGRIARWHPMKDHATFVKAASMIASKRPHARFLLAGSGVTSRNASLTRSLREAGIDDRTTLLGGRTDVPRLLAALDVACSSSSFGEGLPNAVLEAMACGVPCVVTDVGDSRLLVGTYGRVTSPGSAEELASGCLDILEMEPKRRAELGMAGRRRVLTDFDLHRMLQEYEAAYAGVHEAAGAAKAT